MRWLLCLLIVFAVSLAPARGAGATALPAEVAAAMTALEKKDYDAVLSAADAGLRNTGLPADERIGLRTYRAMALEAKGRRDEALAELDTAASDDPTDARPLTTRGTLFHREGKYESALKAHAQAVMREGNIDAAIVANLEYGWLLATGPVGELRDGVRAVDRATRAADLIKENSKTVVAYLYSPRVFDVLAAGLAEKGDFQSAAAMATIAANMAKVVGDAAFVNPGLAERLAAYEAGKAWHQTAK